MDAATLVIAVIACLAAVVAAWYAYYAYRPQRHAVDRARFVQHREALGARRPELTRKALAYYSANAEADLRLPGMLADTGWAPATPFPLDRLDVVLAGVSPAGAAGAQLREEARGILPRKETFRRYASYSEALGELARPKLYDDLPCYRLLSVDLQSDAPTLTVGLTTFFAAVDESEALAHEFAAESPRKEASPAQRRPLRIRGAVPDPYRVSDRTTIMSVSCLTVREGATGSTFYLHARDSSAVAIAGNLLHLAPSGVFQPTADDQATVIRDCSPWLTACREFAEEFLGVEEARGAGGTALSYEEDEPYRSLMRAYREGRVRIHVCGLGLDPLTLCGELVTIAVIDGDSFDTLFADLVTQNEEGTLRGGRLLKGRIEGFPFTEAAVLGFLGSDQLSPAARAALHVAWYSRSTLNLRSSDDSGP
jgi:hypothetical protein